MVPSYGLFGRPTVFSGIVLPLWLGVDFIYLSGPSEFEFDIWGHLLGWYIEHICSIHPLHRDRRILHTYGYSGDAQSEKKFLVLFTFPSGQFFPGKTKTGNPPERETDIPGVFSSQFSLDTFHVLVPILPH